MSYGHLPGFHLFGWDAVTSSWVPVLVNAAGKLIIDPSEILEDTPTDNEVAKAPTSNWAHDHDANPDAHHTKYTNAEAQAVADAQIASHAALPDVHHPEAHTHPDKANLVSGKVPTTELGGTGADNTKYLRGDQAWVAPPGGGGGIQTLKKTANQIINGTAFRDITDLTFAVAINTDYAFKFHIVFRSAATTTGFRFAINGPAGAVVEHFMTYQTIANNELVGVATWLQKHSVGYDQMTALLSTIAANVDLVCMIEGRIKVGATAGTLAARVASELADNNLVVQKGSWGFWF